MSDRARLLQFSAFFVILSNFLEHFGPSVGIMPGQSDIPESIVS